jgi:ferredoxin
LNTTEAPPSCDAPGRYSIQDECDGCGICASFSSYTFAASEDGGRYFIARQPEPGSEEEGIVRDAMAACPLDCIRDDGGA